MPAVTLLLILGLRLKEVTEEGLADTQVVHVSRNFYGVLRVRYDDADGSLDENEEPLPCKYSLTHGQIRHGFPFDDDYWARQPTTYYGRESGLGRAIVVARERAMATDGHALRVGVVGLLLLLSASSAALTEVAPALHRVSHDLRRRSSWWRC